jgi:Trypsin-co-occurring domain 1
MSDQDALRAEKSPPILIQMNNGDGPLVEVTMILPAAKHMSEAHVAKVVSSGFEKIMELMKSIVRPFSETWAELSKEMIISESTVKVSLGVTAEGNFFVTKGSAEANIELELKLSPKPKG